MNGFYAGAGPWKRILYVGLAVAVCASMLSGCAGKAGDKARGTDTPSPETTETVPPPSPADTPNSEPTPSVTPSPTASASPTPVPIETPEATLAPAPIQEAGSYGVFIGLNPEDTARLSGYDTVVIDAAYFSAEEIQTLHDAEQTVYSYLNVGSVEEFRGYYDDFKRDTLGPYEDWPDERWVDVATPKWQDFTVNTLAADLAAKGVDGFFLDNTDVYYVYHRDEIYQGLVAILTGLNALGKPLFINGGDTFVQALIANGQGGLITGVNQEEVFTSIDFDTQTYGLQDAEDSQYYQEYLDQCKEAGLRVYLLEYASDPGAVQPDIAAFCGENGFSYYIAASLELN